ncbi:hypothetical protein D7X48_01035 [bacterium D16-50]|nr:hypothetical protein D7X48_01035 [bacterium D16-50]
MHKTPTLFLAVLCKTQINYKSKKQNLQYLYKKRQQMRGTILQTIVILISENADTLSRFKFYKEDIL